VLDAAIGEPRDEAPRLQKGMHRGTGGHHVGHGAAHAGQIGRVAQAAIGAVADDEL
jgi:hypothetical protein